MKLGDTLFNVNQFKNVILNSVSYKRLILGVNLVWSYFSIAIKSFKTRILADGGTYEGESILEDRLQEITPNLFDSASLVITPNGVKTSKLYSIKPNDGTGDLSVVRNTSATRIDENGNIVNVPANVAKIDYSNGSPAILVEHQRTNLFLRSEEFDNAYWNKSNALTPVVLANSTVSPSSLTDADKITPSSNLTTHWIGKKEVSLTSGVTYSYSVFAKNNGFNIVLSVGGMSVYTNCNFNLSNGTTSIPYNTAGSNLCVPSIVDYGNGWYRCIITFTAWNESNDLLFSVNNNNTTPIGPFGMAAINGDNSKGFYLWGAQIEARSNATSYIPTIASSVTRNSDIISKTGISSLINSQEGVLFFNLRPLLPVPSLGTGYSLSNGTNAELIYMAFTSTANRLLLSVVNSNGINLNINIDNVNFSIFNKIAIKWKQNELKVFINSVNVYNNLSFNTFSINALSVIKLARGDGQRSFEGVVNSALVFPTALTDQQCIDLTTL